MLAKRFNEAIRTTTLSGGVEIAVPWSGLESYGPEVDRIQLYGHADCQAVGDTE